ncbi:MAG TPA: hypothetical protein VFB38_19420 [Chthonomonadaceae bacterium]|nr:hypothetical protein [Chthonomonadaceae bacterium]
MAIRCFLSAISRGRCAGHRSLAVRWLLIGLCCLLPLALRAQQAAPDLSKGALCGKVVDLTTGKPIADATVALQDKNGKVLAWTKTNAQGEYALAADPLTALHLRPSHGRGLLEQIVRAVGDVVTAPVKAVAGIVSEPSKVAESAAVSAATGDPLPTVAQVLAPALGTQDTRQAPANTEKKAKEVAVRTAFGERLAGTNDRPDTLAPGEVFLAVSAPNYKDVKGKAGAYWLDPPDTVDNKKVGLRAWLETTQLAACTCDKNSAICKEALLLAEPRLEPALAEAGDVVKLSVKVHMPAGLTRNIRVFAREEKKRTVAELMRDGKQGPDVYAGRMRLDPKTPSGDTTITLVALRAEPVEVKLDKNKPDPLVEFVRRLDDLSPNKPYNYDPRILASENRLDLKLTILDPKKETPPAYPATVPPTPSSKK